MRNTPSPRPRLAPPVAGFWRNAKGSAATEFAFVAPVLLLLLLATVEVGRAISIDRHFTMATATAGDLVAREEFLGETSTEAGKTLEQMMKSIEHIMQPYDVSDLKMAIFSVRASTTDASNTRVEWVYPHNGADGPAKCAPYTLPAGLIGKGGSTIVVESSYIFKPVFGDFVPGSTMTWTDKSLHSPRNACVDYVKGDNCLWKCP
jgi:Flp pilus assembly protein TadG